MREIAMNKDGRPTTDKQSDLLREILTFDECTDMLNQATSIIQKQLQLLDDYREQERRGQEQIVAVIGLTLIAVTVFLGLLGVLFIYI